MAFGLCAFLIFNPTLCCEKGEAKAGKVEKPPLVSIPFVVVGLLLNLTMIAMEAIIRWPTNAHFYIFSYMIAETVDLFFIS